MPILESDQYDNDKAPEPADNTHLLDDSLNFVKKLPGEVAARAEAIAAIIRSKGKAFTAAEKEIAPLANSASESGTLNFAKGTVETMPKSADPFLGFDQTGFGNLPMKDLAAKIRMQQGVIIKHAE